jgi:threonyl-tRNA synthetase
MCDNHEPDNDEELEGRSHRRIGADLDLFHFSDSAPGMAFWHGPGMVIWNALSAFWREQNDLQGYQEVRSPIVSDSELWKRSGHWDKYRQHMFCFSLDDRDWGLKPMNCPAHIDIYAQRPRSYRELPVRLSEQGLVHRNELSGNVNGLLRARSFSIDDAHLFCRPDQIEPEVQACLQLAARIYELFGLDLRIELSLRPEQRIGDDALWDAAEASLRSALDREGLAYDEEPGGGAFYGPKIDLHVRDSLGRSWQLGSVQLDFQMPQRFDLRYVAEDGRDEDGNQQPNRPVIIHRAMFGSFERFIAILLEHFDGQLPLWCAPRPALILPRGRDDDAYAGELARELRAAGVRAEISHVGSLGKRIRAAEMVRVPEDGSVALRLRGGEQRELSRVKAVEQLAAAVRERRREL